MLGAQEQPVQLQVRGVDTLSVRVKHGATLQQQTERGVYALGGWHRSICRHHHRRHPHFLLVLLHPGEH